MLAREADYARKKLLFGYIHFIKSTPINLKMIFNDCILQHKILISIGVKYRIQSYRKSSGGKTKLLDKY